jgi:hypothetical protein
MSNAFLQNLTSVSPLSIKLDGEKLVTAIAPKDFFIRLTNAKRIFIKEGIQEVPESLLKHWYAKANGLKAYAPVTVAEPVDVVAAPVVVKVKKQAPMKVLTPAPEDTTASAIVD